MTEPVKVVRFFNEASSLQEDLLCPLLLQAFHWVAEFASSCDDWLLLGWQSLCVRFALLGVQKYDNGDFVAKGCRPAGCLNLHRGSRGRFDNQRRKLEALCHHCMFLAAEMFLFFNPGRCAGDDRPAAVLPSRGGLWRTQRQLVPEQCATRISWSMPLRRSKLPL